MRNEVYASYHEKFVKNTIIYASLDTNLLYFSKDMNPKDLVSKKELKNLFEKGLIIDDGRNLYKPVKLSKNPETNEYDVIVYDETKACVFSSPEKSNLILNHAIYQELYDSNLNILLDSAGGSILGEVIFSDVEDVTRLHKRIDDLETIINQLASLLINNRLVVVETSMTEANESIAMINEHALFDSTFI
jgi:hypothetical protein